MAANGPIRDVIVSRVMNDRPNVPAQIAGIIDVLVDLATAIQDIRTLKEYLK